MELIWTTGDDSYREGQSPYAHLRLDRPFQDARVIDPGQTVQRQTIAISDQPDLSLDELIERAFAP